MSMKNNFTQRNTRKMNSSINFYKTIRSALYRNKTLSFINILGLSIGLSASILILQYVCFEMSFDRNIKNSDRIYRVNQINYKNGSVSSKWAAGCASVGLALKNTFPEIENYVRIKKVRSLLVSSNDRIYKETSIFYTTSDFFNIFSYRITKGKKEHVLVEPYHVVITERMAEKYFPNEDPIGKSLKINMHSKYIVEAVCKNPPSNTHLKFDFLISWPTWNILNNREINEDNTWNQNGFLNYIKLYPKTNIDELEQKIPDLVDQKWDVATLQSGIKPAFEFMPIQKIHLHSNLASEIEQNGNAKSTYFLLIVAILLLLIVWINYVNLSTAHSVERAKEVGLKKVVGATRSSLIKQFLLESSIINFISIGVAAILILLFIPQFSMSTGTEVNFSYLFNNRFWYIVMLIYLLGTILACLYPAIVLSSFQPKSVLKGSIKNTSKGIIFRKSLVIFQFTISLILITATLTIFKQISFMKNQDKNFNYENVLVLKGPLASDSTYVNRFQAFKNELLQKASIKDVSASVSIPGRKPLWSAGGIRLEGTPKKDSHEFRIMVVDHDFLEVYQLKLVAGRFFNKQYRTDQNAILLNESGMYLLGYKDVQKIINKRVWYGGTIYNVIGIIEDYNQESLKSSFEPYIFRLIPNVRSFYSIKVNQGNYSQLINEIDNLWKDYFPNTPFEYFFAENYYNEQYNDEDQFGAIFLMFSVIVIIVACLGLYSLASYSLIQRTKEIGIRRILGSSPFSIIKLISTEYIKLLVISVIIGIPVSYAFLNDWLTGFVNHIDLDFCLLILPLILVVVITLLTISSNILKAIKMKPIESLKYE